MFGPELCHQPLPATEEDETGDRSGQNKRPTKTWDSVTWDKDQNGWSRVINILILVLHSIFIYLEK